MRPLVLAIVVLALGCGTKSEPRSEVATVPVPLPIVAAPPADAAPSEKAPAARATFARTRLQLNLRSTPEGATASIDGRVIGTTPARWEMEDDGRAHNFTFILAGYAPWRLRFSPVRDGVIHATLRPNEGPDAGTR